MSHEVLQQLAKIHDRMFEIRGAALLEELAAKISDLHTQLKIQVCFDEMSSLIRNKNPLPLRRMGENLKKLLKEESRWRWSRLLELDFRSLVFCTFSCQALASLEKKRFDVLVDNVERYLQTQALPTDWILTDKILKAAKKVPKQAHTMVFWEKYHKIKLEHHTLELEQSNTKNSLESEDQSHIQFTPGSERAEETPQGLRGLEGSILEMRSMLVSGGMVERKRSRSKQNLVLEPGLAEPSPKRTRLELQHVHGSAKPLENDNYFSFCLVKPERIQSLPEFFLDGMKMSRSWEANRGAAAIENCLSLHFPKIKNEDAIFQIKLDYNSGWKLFNILGLGDWTFP